MDKLLFQKNKGFTYLVRGIKEIEGFLSSKRLIS